MVFSGLSAAIIIIIINLFPLSYSLGNFLFYLFFISTVKSIGEKKNKVLKPKKRSLLLSVLFLVLCNELIFFFSHYFPFVTPSLLHHEVCFFTWLLLSIFCIIICVISVA